MAVTYSRYKFVTVSLPKRFRNGRFTSDDNNTRINTKLGQGPGPKEIRSMLRFDI